MKPPPSLRELPPLPEPTFIACDTEGADFDVTFVTTKAEARDVVDPEHPNPEELFTLLYTAEQMKAYALAAMEDKKCPVGIDWCPQGKVEP